jgi:hypothetical protein
MTTSHRKSDKSVDAHYVLVFATVVLLVVLVSSLDRSPSDRSFVIVGGVAGALASSIATLIRTGGQRAAVDVFNKYGLLGPIIPAVAGFAAGTFSLLTVTALFAPMTRSLTSAAVFGGIYGLLLEPILRGAATGADEHTILGAVLQHAHSEMTASESHKYNGTIFVQFKANDSAGRVAGAVNISFVPEELSATHEEPLGAIKGPVRVDEGIASDSVPFDVGILAPAGFSAFPRTRTVAIPATQASDTYSFTLVRDGQAETLESAAEVTPASGSHGAEILPVSTEVSARLNAPTKGRSSKPVSIDVVVIDISQSGRTIQLIEVPMTRSSSAAQSASNNTSVS